MALFNKVNNTPIYGVKWDENTVAGISNPYPHPYNSPHPHPYGGPYPSVNVTSVSPLPDLSTPEEIQSALEFIENCMLLIQVQLDEADVPNRGGAMDHNEAVIDLGDFEIVIRKK